jgi:hypothetical protein
VTMKRKLPPSANYQIVRAIMDKGNQPGLIAEWFAGMRKWAEVNKGADAEALRLWLDIVKPRPFYNAEDLAGFWPALKLHLGLCDYLSPRPSANRLQNELMFHRLPLLKNADTGANYFPGQGTLFIVERVHYWSKRPVSENELQTVLCGGEIE